MKTKTILLFVAATLCLWSPFGNQAHAQATANFPFGKRWKGKSYGKTDGWFSSGILIAHRPTPETELIGRRNQIIYGLEARYHLNSRLAFMAGVHFGGHTEEIQGTSGVGDYTTDETSPGVSSTYTSSDNRVEQVYRETSWQLGVDFGLIESKYFHIQAGPRLAATLASVELEGSVNYSEATSTLPDDISSTALTPGLAIRAGLFATPYVEVGLHVQADYSMGTKNAGFGREVGGYSVVHF